MNASPDTASVGCGSCYLVVAIGDVLVEPALAVKYRITYVDELAACAHRSVHLQHSHYHLNTASL